MEGFERGYEIIKDCEDKVVKGYITSIPGKEGSPEIYDEFMPFRPRNLPEDTKVLEYENVHPPNPPSLSPTRTHPFTPLLSLPSFSSPFPCQRRLSC